MTPKIGNLYQVNTDKISCTERSTGIGRIMPWCSIVTFLGTEPCDGKNNYFFLYDGKVVYRWLSHEDTFSWWFTEIKTE